MWAAVEAYSTRGMIHQPPDPGYCCPVHLFTLYNLKPQMALGILPLCGDGLAG
jgi:hypothetical protein